MCRRGLGPRSSPSSSAREPVVHVANRARVQPARTLQHVGRHGGGTATGPPDPLERVVAPRLLGHAQPVAATMRRRKAAAADTASGTRSGSRTRRTAVAGRRTTARAAARSPRAPSSARPLTASSAQRAPLATPGVVHSRVPLGIHLLELVEAEIEAACLGNPQVRADRRRPVAPSRAGPRAAIARDATPSRPAPPAATDPADARRRAASGR